MIVRRLSEGGQSIKIFSYFENKFSFFLKISFNKNALLGSFAVSTSKPDKFTFELIKSRFFTQLSCITNSGFYCPIMIL